VLVYDTFDQWLAENSFQAVCLYDCDENRVLYARNEHMPAPVASLTKIAAAMAALECTADPDGTFIEVTRPAVNEVHRLDGFCAGFDEQIGMRFSVTEYLSGLLIASGCEAGMLLADSLCAGDRDAFVARMNRLALRAGCRNTCFRDPCGLLDEGVSSAFDVFLLFRRMLEIPLLRGIASATTRIIPGLPDPVLTTNRLKRFASPVFFPYAACGKTGTSDLAGKCLACSYERRGKTYIAIVLGYPFVLGQTATDSFWRSAADSLLCTAFAREGPFMRVTLDRHLLKAGAGDRLPLLPRAVFNNTGEAPRFRFRSLNPEVAAVDGQGLVTVLQPGLAQIEILSQTGDYDLACVNACGSDFVSVSRPRGVGAISAHPSF